MKKLYLFLTPSIVNIGGAEIYVRNKNRYLNNNGWETFVFSFRKGDIIVDGLSKFYELIFEEFQTEPYLYSRNQQNKIINRIISLLPDLSKYDEIVIESNSINISLWGEILARIINGIHLVFFLQENESIGYKKFKYLKFKHARKELAGINKKVIKNLFSPYEDIPVEESYNLRASCINSVEDIPCDKWRNVKKSDFTLGSIGRLEKPYLQTVIKDLYEFILAYPKYTYNLIFIGGETNGDKVSKQIIEKFKNFDNVNVYITGFIFPIPLTLLKQIDIFLSSAGSVRVSSDLNKPTISYDSNDLQPIGLKNFTTDNSLFRTNEKIIKGKEWLEKVLINREFKLEEFKFTPLHFSFSDHIEFLSSSKHTKDYYDISSWKLSRKDLIKKILVSIHARRLIYKVAKMRKNY